MRRQRRRGVTRCARRNAPRATWATWAATCARMAEAAGARLQVRAAVRGHRGPPLRVTSRSLQRRRQRAPISCATRQRAPRKARGDPVWVSAPTITYVPHVTDATDITDGTEVTDVTDGTDVTDITDITDGTDVTYFGCVHPPSRRQPRRYISYTRCTRYLGRRFRPDGTLFGPLHRQRRRVHRRQRRGRLEAQLITRLAPKLRGFDGREGYVAAEYAGRWRWREASRGVRGPFGERVAQRGVTRRNVSFVCNVRNVCSGAPCGQRMV